MNHLFKYIKTQSGKMLIGLLIKFIGTMSDLAIPALLAKIIKDYTSKGDEKYIFLWGGVMIICAFVSVTANIVANRFAAVTSGRITKLIRHDLFERICHLSSSQVDKFTVPSLVSRLTSDTYNVNQMLGRIQRIGVRGPILLIGGIIVTLAIDPVLTLVLVATLPFIALIVYFVTKYSVPAYTRVQSSLDNLTRSVQENFTGVRVIKALSKTEYEKNKFNTKNEKLTKDEKFSELLMSVTNPMTSIILNLGLTAIVVFGAYRTNSGLTDAANIIAFQSYFTIILNAMLGITRVFVVCTKAIASAERIDEVLQTPYDMQVAESRETSEHYIEFRNVTFSYNKNIPNVKNVSFTLEKGQTLGIIGPTGGGKTTLISLLNRFYDPDEGAVFIDGKDIRSMENKRLRKIIGNAFQNDFFFAGDIYGNVSFFRDLPIEKVKKAADNAFAGEFVAGYKEGFNHEVEQRAGNMSGGQKQRLLISRAMADNPDILILDDSSSALDYETDRYLRKSLKENYKNATKILVSGRVASLKNSDLILVVDDGRITCMGNHEYLMAHSDYYRETATVQMGDGGDL